MLTPLKRTLGAAGLSLSLGLAAITASASPAAADNNNLRNFLGAAGALLIIGAIVENNRSDRRPTPANRHVVAPPAQYSFVAPGRCFSRFQGPSVNLRAFGANCMHRHATYRDRLPAACRARIHTYQGWREVYDAQCLYRHGWVRS